MSLELHTSELVAGTQPTRQDRVIVGFQTVANVAGAGEGDAVVTAVTFDEPLPPDYNVQVTPGQDAVPFVSGKTQAGFNVTLNPRLAANTLAAGTFDVLVAA